MAITVFAKIFHSWCNRKIFIFTCTTMKMKKYWWWLQPWSYGHISCNTGKPYNACMFGYANWSLHLNPYQIMVTEIQYAINDHSVMAHNVAIPNIDFWWSSTTTMAPTIASLFALLTLNQFFQSFSYNKSHPQIILN